MQTPSLFLAFIAGLVSFLSPCVLPLVPAYIGYLSGPAVMSARGASRAGRGPAQNDVSLGKGSAQGTVGSSSGGGTAPSQAPAVVAAAAQNLEVGSVAGSGGLAARPHSLAPVRPARPGPATRVARALVSPSPRWVVMGHALLFVLGFTFVFVVVIGGLAGFLSEVLRQNKTMVQSVMGVTLVIFGLHMIGLINIPFMNYTRRLDVRPSEKLGYTRSLLIGLGFGIGWTPCIGPTLGAIFTLALNGKQADAFPLFMAYSLGLGIPFLAAAMAMGQISAGLKRVSRRSYSLQIGSWRAIDQANIISLVSGGLLIIMGVLIYTNTLTMLNRIAPSFGV